MGNIKWCHEVESDYEQRSSELKYAITLHRSYYSLSRYLSREWIHNMHPCTHSLHENKGGDIGEVPSELLGEDDEIVL
jgi:hypothetical protein